MDRQYVEYVTHVERVDIIIFFRLVFNHVSMCRFMHMWSHVSMESRRGCCVPWSCR